MDDGSSSDVEKGDGEAIPEVLYLYDEASADKVQRRILVPTTGRSDRRTAWVVRVTLALTLICTILAMKIASWKAFEKNRVPEIFHRPHGQDHTTVPTPSTTTVATVSPTDNMAGVSGDKSILQQSYEKEPFVTTSQSKGTSGSSNIFH